MDEDETVEVKSSYDSKVVRALNCKISSVRHDYSAHNKEAVKNAIFNATIIAAIGLTALKMSPEISGFVSNYVQLLSEQTGNIANLPGGNLLALVYSKSIDFVGDVVNKLGGTGIILTSLAIKTIVQAAKDTHNSLKIKNDIISLERIRDMAKKSNSESGKKV